jgi:hypothetical protein
MSTMEILAELPRLSPAERAEILERLWHLEEEAGPSVPERRMLDEAEASYRVDGDAGAPWREVEARLRGRA